MNRPPVEVRITNSDIMLGKRGNCRRCAVAIALRRAGYQIYDGVAQEAAHASVFLLGGNVLDLPTEVALFIQRFDDELPVEPFTFLLPDEGRVPTYNVDPEDAE